MNQTHVRTWTDDDGHDVCAGERLAGLAASKRGSWFQSPHVCIPAISASGSLIVLIEPDRWHSLLASHGGRVNEAKAAALDKARRSGTWVPGFGEPAVLVA